MHWQAKGGIKLKNISSIKLSFFRLSIKIYRQYLWEGSKLVLVICQIDIYGQYWLFIWTLIFAKSFLVNTVENGTTYNFLYDNFRFLSFLKKSSYNAQQNKKSLQQRHKSVRIKSMIYFYWSLYCVYPFTCVPLQTITSIYFILILLIPHANITKSIRNLQRKGRYV